MCWKGDCFVGEGLVRARFVWEATGRDKPCPYSEEIYLPNQPIGLPERSTHTLFTWV